MELMEDDVKAADLVLWVGISFQQSASAAYFRKVRCWIQVRGLGRPFCLGWGEGCGRGLAYWEAATLRWSCSASRQAPAAPRRGPAPPPTALWPLPPLAPPAID